MHWYVIHTKPRQEQRALLNLERQHYTCFLPMLAIEKLHKGKLAVVQEPLFPRYLFIQLDTNQSSQSWAPIRSTKGVSRLVTFGNEPAKASEELIKVLSEQNRAIVQQPKKLFTPGERVLIADGPFAGIEALFQMQDGDSRVMVLIELLNKPTALTIASSKLRKIN
ncbi:transcription/translation regulatory transformer protein RfaH [Oxalobacter sp. OttesenSCG-928-P03]|nr:transcription/translation regulatory transformer protein RfaH [Oxalobacter sp. OttesenSCG-928-P03]